MVFENIQEIGLNRTLKAESSTVPPVVMSQGLGQLHVVFLRVPVLAPFSS